MKKLEKQDLLDILYGCTILGTGGGGSLEEGINLIDKAIRAGKEFHLVTFDELEENDLIATPYSCGAISPETEAERKKYEKLPVHPESPHVLALSEMEKHLGKEVKAVISTELGGGNTAVAFYAAAMAGKMIVDGDPAGRSVPELQHSTYYLHNIPIHPMAVVNEFGEAAVITHVVDDFRAEALVRALAIVSRNRIAVVDHVQPASVLKNAVIQGAISDAWRIGKAWRMAVEAGDDPVTAVTQTGDGAVLFQGVVSRNAWDTVEGFTVGEVELEGVCENAGETYRIWYKNENIMTWKNGTPHASVPDLVCVINESSGRPVINPYFEEGMNVIVYVLPSPVEWTTQKGLDVFGPESFGFPHGWRPFREILGT